MVVSSFDEKLYLASSRNTSNDLITEVYRFSIDKTAEEIAGLTLEDTVEVNCPQPAICSTYPTLCDPGLGYTATIVSMAQNPQDGTLYVAGFTAPKFPEAEKLPSQVKEEVFTTPTLAFIAADANEQVEASVFAACDLALPSSIVWTGTLPKCGGADFGPDGTVNWIDLSVISQYWLETNCEALDDCGGADLEPVGEPDGDVDLRDLAVFAQYWLDAGCL
jgi:hypothetical protein